MKGKSNSSKKTNTTKASTTKKVATPKAKGSNKQNIIVAGLILVILICVFLSIKTIVKSQKEDEPTNKSDISEEILKDTTVGNLSITNARLIVDNGLTSFMATATNETESEYHVNVLYVTFTNGNTTRKIPVLSDITLAPKEHTPITLTLDSDISDTTKIDYEVQ